MSLSEVQIVSTPSTPLAVVRRLVRAADLPRVVPHGCGLVWNFLRAHGLRGGRNVALYRDSAINLEVGVECADALPEDGDVVRSATLAGRVALVTQLGPYAGLGGAHDAIRRWCAERGERPAGPSWEIYGHWEGAWNSDPGLIRTEVCYLLAER